MRLQAVRSPWRTLGWPGLAGALALAAALWVARGGLPPPGAGQPVPAAAAVLPAQQHTRPPSAPVSERLAQLLELALREGVTVLRAEQRARGAGEPGTRVHMPARGGYAELRRFAEAALAADPALALESLRLQRNTVSDPVLQAEFVWWVAGDGP